MWGFDGYFKTVNKKLDSILHSEALIMATLKDVQDAQAEETVAIGKIATDIQALKDKIAAGGAVTMADLDGIVANAKAGTAELTADDTAANS